MATKKRSLKQVAQAAKMPSAKAGKARSFGRGMTAHKIPSGKSMSVGAGITKPGRGKAPGRPQAAGSRKVSRAKVKVPKGPAIPAMLGGKKKKAAPPFPGAAPPLM
jgi:hypothetical protein